MTDTKHISPENQRILRDNTETVTVSSLTISTARSAIRNEIARFAYELGGNWHSHVTADTTDEEILDNTGRDKRGMMLANNLFIYRNLLLAMRELTKESP